MEEVTLTHNITRMRQTVQHGRRIFCGVAVEHINQSRERVVYGKCKIAGVPYAVKQVGPSQWETF